MTAKQFWIFTLVLAAGATIAYPLVGGWSVAVGLLAGLRVVRSMRAREARERANMTAYPVAALLNDRPLLCRSIHPETRIQGRARQPRGVFGIS